MRTVSQVFDSGTPVVHPFLQLLSSREANEWMEPYIPRVYIEMGNRKGSSITIYDSESDKEKCKEFISLLISKIEDLSTCLTEFMGYFINPHAKRELLKQRSNIVKKYSLFDLRYEGSKVIVRGMASAVEAFKTEYHLKYLSDEPASKEVRNSCFLCKKAIDDPFEPAVCGHAACRQCLVDLLTPNDGRVGVQLPILCSICSSPFTWPALVSLLSSKELEDFKEISVDHYVSQHNDCLTHCLRPDCKNILSLEKIKLASNETDEVVLGAGRLLSCDSCKTGFCLVCSERENKTVLEHKWSYCNMVGKECPISTRRKILMSTKVNDLQARALKALEEDSKNLSDSGISGLFARYKGLGLTEVDLIKSLKFIENCAPVIIHVRMDTLVDFFIKDTHYRNCFEVSGGVGGGRSDYNQSRIGWETRIFKGIYDQARPSERVKYGSLNVSADPKGNAPCIPYGDSYFLLRNDSVRLRTTFTDNDSSCSSCVLGMMEYYSHILSRFPDTEIQQLASLASKGNVPWLSSSSFSHVYREAQIHGDLSFKDDFEALFLNSRHQHDKVLMNKVDQFCLKNGIKLMHM
jgi:hypothetical protein